VARGGVLLLSPIRNDWRAALAIVQPETVIALASQRASRVLDLEGSVREGEISWRSAMFSNSSEVRDRKADPRAINAVRRMLRRIEYELWGVVQALSSQTD
jgi:hypothetical protein